MTAPARSPTLRVRGLVKRYRRGLLAQRVAQAAVDDVDLDLLPGEVLALVGESGSGKTTLSRCALGLLPFERGSIEVFGTSMQSLSGRRLDRFRKRVQPLFQDPNAHLNPGLSVRRILVETARLHRAGEPEQPLVDAVLRQVGLVERAEALPHELSGGERRRVGIARLLLCRPELIIADEPTAGLDAARKAEVMELLLAAGGDQRSILIISHDLPLVAASADRLAVMVAGRIVERCPASGLATSAHHPYTDELLGAAGLSAGGSTLSDARDRALDRPSGCPFATRCQLAGPLCHTQRPAEVHLGPGHSVACHAAAELAAPLAGTSSPPSPPPLHP